MKFPVVKGRSWRKADFGLASPGELALMPYDQHAPVPSQAHDYKVGSLEIARPWARATPRAPVAGGSLTITAMALSPIACSAALLRWPRPSRFTSPRQPPAWPGCVLPRTDFDRARRNPRAEARRRAHSVRRADRSAERRRKIFGNSQFREGRRSRG